MEGIENTIQQILGDPESMAQILSIAKSFGLPDPPEQEAAPKKDDDYLLPMVELLKNSAVPPQETRLLEALKPYFSHERQLRLERAGRIARIAQLAGTALKTMTRKE